MIELERIKAVTANGEPACPRKGVVKWSPARSLWTLLLTGFGVIGGLATLSWEGALVFFASTAATIGLGHSIGMHRLLIHRSFKTFKLVEYVLVWLGVLVGMAGPIGMIRIHDLRDWAQRQTQCHDFFAHRAGFWTDAWRQTNCSIALDHPPLFALEAEVRDDPVYRFIERSWMLQQLPVALIFFLIGGWLWVIWGVALRVAVSLFGHWLVGYYAHRNGHQGWRVEGAAVQGFNLPIAALITFGESWHANHHAFPGSARLGVEHGQLDPGWITLLVLERVGLVWDIVTPSSLPARAELRRIDPYAADSEGAQRGEATIAASP
ncbi:MAG: acyl-CoA desaturase [Pseudomonadota bacterium]